MDRCLNVTPFVAFVFVLLLITKTACFYQALVVKK